MNSLFQWLADLVKGAKVWQIVLPWERAVRVRFGSRCRVWEPGLHFRLPFFDQVKVVNTRLRIAAVPSQTLQTRDGRVLTIAALVGFRIADPLRAMLRLQQPENVCAAFAQGCDRAAAEGVQHGGGLRPPAVGGGGPGRAGRLRGRRARGRLRPRGRVRGRSRRSASCRTPGGPTRGHGGEL